MKSMKKALCVGALATATALGTVGTAVAAPAPASQVHIPTRSTAPARTTTAVTSHVPVKGSGHIASRDGIMAPDVDPVVFNCSYVSVVPFQSLQFTCGVTSGRLQLFLSCSNGAKVYSAIMPAIGTYHPLLSCPSGTQFTLINWQAV